MIYPSSRPDPVPKPPFSALLWIYVRVMRRLGFVAHRILKKRVKAGKEDPARVWEKLGQTSEPRPDGPLVWFHAVSVGESRSILDLIHALSESHPQAQILVTTTTATSAQLLQNDMPRNCRHQYFPVDAGGAVERFLRHWRPDLAVWVQSELWPGAVHDVHKAGVPLIMVEARMTKESLTSWQKRPKLARAMMARFDQVLAQDTVTAEGLLALGLPAERLRRTGTMKQSLVPQPVDETQRAQLESAIGSRPVWLAASTHPSEEVLALEAHEQLRHSHPEALLILAPRHPERAPEVAALLEDRGLTWQQRSRGALPEAGTSVYLADTLGEMGLWYALAPATFLGGSFANKGGHNPFEPISQDTALVHGPHTQNAAAIYERLTQAHASARINSSAELAEAIDQRLWRNQSRPYAALARNLCQEDSQALSQAHALIAAYLP